MHLHTFGEPPPPAKRVRLIGRRADLLAAGAWHGVDVLEVADARWSEGLNVRWVRKGLLARQSFRAVSAHCPANLRQRTRGSWRPAVFARELEWLARATGGHMPVSDPVPVLDARLLDAGPHARARFIEAPWGCGARSAAPRLPDAG